VVERLRQVGFPQHDEAPRILEWQGTQHDPIEDAEDRGNRSNPQSQREHCGDCEFLRAKKIPDSVSDVSQQTVHGAPQPL